MDAVDRASSANGNQWATLAISVSSEGFTLVNETLTSLNGAVVRVHRHSYQVELGHFHVGVDHNLALGVPIVDEIF